MEKFNVSGTFDAVVYAENGKKIKELLDEMPKPNNIELLKFSAEEYWEEK